MIRPPLRPEEHDRGRALGRALRSARGPRSILDVAAEAGISPETLRKIETGRIATPAFFTIMALCDALDIAPGELAGHSRPEHPMTG
ncbi:helix-turn-helix domain-containing protein [Glycomyces harbinensis]|uniref:Helix-turn-helix domain-containing protein n=1 Tax=Glycomyces harbinensis TaxID=58114 RepID=A0A1G6Z6N8_9ACTN|nr:helix-turn-helix transcriptional regulator [Glycomyces harbinensis]SDD98122.1 Helix-turn-helix domain-containing protein [Glycomyces harbinensis]